MEYLTVLVWVYGVVSAVCVVWERMKALVHIPLTCAPYCVGLKTRTVAPNALTSLNASDTMLNEFSIKILLAC